MSKKISFRGRQGRTPSKKLLLLRSYREKIAPTDKLPEHDLRPVLLGLFGEVGSIMTTAKKRHREQKAYADTGYHHAAEEEFGDTLWYFTALCKRLGFNVEDILQEGKVVKEWSKVPVAHNLTITPDSPLSSPSGLASLEDTLFKLGESAASMFEVKDSQNNAAALLRAFGRCYEKALESAEMTLDQVVAKNTDKVCGRFLDPEPSRLPTFDETFMEEERLPQQFEIKITQRKSGQCYLQMNNVFVGEPLTDNIADPDGYRFHDVFHFAHASILHWSPTFRALIKHKRKSIPIVDETQDGGRAIVVEEGLTAWIFVRAKELNFFKGQDKVSFDLLKGVSQFVRGYEVEKCPLKLWEQAILQGYEVFRQVRDKKGGIVVGNRATRTISYKPLMGG